MIGIGKVCSVNQPLSNKVLRNRVTPSYSKAKGHNKRFI